MASARRILQINSGQYPTVPAAEPPDPLAVDSNFVVILVALTCGLIITVIGGVALVVPCARSRRSAASKGLKKKALRALPKLAYEDAVAARGAGEEKTLAECAICLSEFVEKEEVRVLPPCGHGFHVACVDPWLTAHSSCPSCRCVLVVNARNAPPELTPEPGR